MTKGQKILLTAALVLVWLFVIGLIVENLNMPEAPIASFLFGGFMGIILLLIWD